MKCKNCEHYNICVVCNYMHDKCGYYKPTKPHGEITRLIDAEALLKDFEERARSARNWKEAALNSGNEESAVRADAVLTFLCEVKLTIEDAPTIEIETGSEQQRWREGK